MLILTGEYELTLDEKNRLSIPARLREQIPEGEIDKGFYLTMGVNRIMSLYPDSYYQRIALAVAPGKAAPDESLIFERINYALAGRVELDRQGRVLLPEKAIRRAGLKERATLIGVRDHLELWDPEKWERYMQDHLGNHEQMLLMMRAEAMRQDQEMTTGYQQEAAVRREQEPADR
ncbi:MAG: hypothetical protein AMJ79_13635 [Phycisphaerae bacterium SM23_30]|nr:MAG: hypothetical protein AMJ79_13635 [Phycisphaerae bacterium SM23_30]